MTTEILSRGKTAPVLSEKLNTSKHVKSLANPAHKGKGKNSGSTNSIKKEVLETEILKRFTPSPVLPFCQESSMTALEHDLPWFLLGQQQCPYWEPRKAAQG